MLAEHERNRARRGAEQARRVNPDERTAAGNRARTLRDVEDAGFDLGDVFEAFKPIVRGAIMGAIGTGGFFGRIIGSVVDEALDAAQDAVS